MKVFASALLLVVGTALLTFSAISFGIFPRPLSLGNPALFVEALAIAGLAFWASALVAFIGFTGPFLAAPP